MCVTCVFLQVRATSARWRSTTRTAKSSFLTTGNRWATDCQRHPSLCLLKPGRFSLHSSRPLGEPPLKATINFSWFEKRKKSHLLDFCDGQVVCVYSSVTRVCCRLRLLCVCLCATLCGGILQKHRCSLLSSFFLFLFFYVLSFGKKSGTGSHVNLARLK